MCVAVAVGPWFQHRAWAMTDAHVCSKMTHQKLGVCTPNMYSPVGDPLCHILLWVPKIGEHHISKQIKLVKYGNSPLHEQAGAIPLQMGQSKLCPAYAKALQLTNKRTISMWRCSFTQRGCCQFTQKHGKEVSSCSIM